MIRIILTADARVAETFVQVLALEKKDATQEAFSLYKKWAWMLISYVGISLQEAHDLVIQEYLPDIVYIPYFGRTIDVVHEVGDVVLPNVFLRYNPLIETEEINETNRDEFLGEARFLEIFDEQKDYLVEDYGLSIGGIAVGALPPNNHELELSDRLMLAYEADIYTESDMFGAVEIARENMATTMIICGSIEWKLPKNLNGTTMQHTARNMLTTIRLLEEDVMETTEVEIDL